MSDNNYENNKLITSGINSNITAGKIYVPPPPVGYWLIGGGFPIAVLTRPTEQQIANTTEQFGWEWRDYNET